MKNNLITKFLGILVLSLLWCNIGNAGVKEPGKINSLQCAIGAMEAYQDAKEYREANPKKTQLFTFHAWAQNIVGIGEDSKI